MTNIETMLLGALLNFLVLGSIAGLTIGAILILRPRWLQRMSQIANRWISTRRFDKFLETTINIDHWFYRYRRTSTSATIAGAIFMLYYFSVKIDKASVISGLGNRFSISPAYFSALFDPMVMIAISGAAFALFVSLFMLLRPYLFRKFEHSSNKWVSLRRTMKPLEIMRSSVDAFTFRHTLPIGVMLMLGSVYTLGMISFWARSAWF